MSKLSIVKLKKLAPIERKPFITIARICFQNKNDFYEIHV